MVAQRPDITSESWTGNVPAIEEISPPEKADEALPTTQKTAFDKLMELSDGGDYLEMFGGAGHGKSRLLAHISLEAKKAGKRVIFLDCEHSLPKRIQIALGDSYKRLGFMDLDKIINEIAKLADGYNLICYDSVGFPVLINFADMRMRERGDAIMKTVLLRGYLKDYAEVNKALALGTNQPKSELWGAGRNIESKDLEEMTPPVGGKSIHVAKAVIRMSIERQTETETMFGLRAFECQDMPFNKLLATFTISEQGEKLEWKI